jgi:hypothetical protein
MLVAIVAIAIAIIIIIILFLPIPSSHSCHESGRRKKENGRDVDLPLKVFQITEMG